MKKEENKRSKLWLWIVIGLVALLAVAGVVVALVSGGGEATEPSSTRPQLYWNLDRDIYMEKGALSSSREKAEDGFFHIRFAYEGNQVEKMVADKQLVNFIDTMYVMGLVFDGDGNVVDALPVKEIATVISEDAYVQSVGQTGFTTNSSIAMNGMKKEVVVSELVKIYDVSSTAEHPGQEIAIDQLGVMDKVCVYADAQNQITHVFVASHPAESKVYWRANQFTSGGKTTREKDENGYYTIPFYCEGELVEFKSKDEVEVSYIDKQSRYSAHFGLVFDDDGYIIEAILSSEAIRGIIRSERYDVTAIEGNKIMTTKIIGSNAGVTDEFVLGADCPIYDVSPAAKSEDRCGKPVDSLQVGDRIVCFADAEGNPLFVYVSERVVEEAVWCYNRTRKYDSTLKQTKRVPDADGWYVFDVFAEGKVMQVKTKDKAVATEMDSVGAAVFGLILDGDVVVEVYGVTSVFGYSHFCQGRYVDSISGSIFSCFSPSNTSKVTTGVMDPTCKVWNLSEIGTYGEETKLQVGDYIYAYQNPSLNIVQIWVMRRKVDLPVYHSVQRMYNSTKKETTRTPDEDGWYIFEVAHNGKLTTVKTKSKALASKMDSFTPAMALRVGSDGVVYEAYDGRYATGGYRRAHGYTVTAINGRTVETRYKNSDGTYATRTLTLANNCQTFNVNSLYEKNFGEYTTVRVGDTITAYTNMYEETEILWVRGRQTDKLYWNQQKLYDDTNAVSLREPDAEGWYVYTLANSDGKVETLKTKDKAIADKVDYYGGAFTLKVKDGIITGVGSPSYAKNTTGASLLNYDVVKISGNKVTLQYHAEGSSKDGEIKVITLNSKVKIFEVGPDAKKFGAAVKLQVGDRIRAYISDVDDTYTYVFIRFHDSRKDGVDGYCDVCKKDVYWQPWVGGSFSTAGGHFYLPADTETSYLPCSTGRSSLPTCTVCLDLNGNTYNRTKGRAMYVYANATLNIMDCAGGGEVVSFGIDKGTSGGVLGVAGGTVNFYSGTLRMSDEHAEAVRGGVVYVGTNSSVKAVGTFNMYGGTIKNGEVLGRGGNVNIAGGVFNLYDGVIENGNVIGGYSGEHGGGGNILTLSNGIFNMYGGTVTGGTCYGGGGNIYGGTGEVNLYGGTVSNGTSKNSGGGNIYAIEKLRIAGATISGGVSEKKGGGNIYMLQYNEKTSLEITDGTITGGTAATYGGNLYTETGADIKGVAITDGKAANGGNIYSNKDTTFTDCTISGGKTTAEKGSGGNAYIGSGNWTLTNTTVSGGVSGARGGNLYASNAVITMNSGTITGGVSGTGNANGGGNVCTISNSTFILNGGTVSDGVSVNTGGNILSGSGGLQVNGGTITGGTAPTAGADVYVYGGSTDVVITGGSLGTMQIADVKSLVMSGKPAFDKLILGGGVVADIENLDKNAAINLEASGIFTEKLTDARDYLGCFTTQLEGVAIYVEEDALAMAAGVKEAYCSHCDSTVLWKQWAGVGSEGHYYLDDTYTHTDKYGTEILADNLVVLDLAGHTMIGDKVRAFDINGELFVLDSVGGGEIVTGGLTDENAVGGVIRTRKGTLTVLGGTLRMADDHSTTIKNGGVIYIDKTGEVTLKGGAVMNGVTTERGGNIYLANGGAKLTLDGATVTGGTCGTGNSNGGGNIAVLSSSVVDIKSGVVSGGNSPKTAGNILATGMLNISGGEIFGGTATGVAQNIYSMTNASKVTVTGGQIESLTSKVPAVLEISGNPKLGMVELLDNQVITLGDLTDGADITVDAVGVFTTEHANAQSFVQNHYVKAADPAMEVTVTDNKLAVTPTEDPKAYCEHCKAEITWNVWDGVATDGHYYLPASMTVSAAITIPADDTLELDLRGRTLENAGGNVFVLKGSLVIQDSVGGGEIIGAATASGGVINADGGKTLDLYSGTLRYDSNAAGASNGGVLYVHNGTQVNLHGGTITGGKTTGRGGNIYLNGSTTVVNLIGATITDGYAKGNTAVGGGNVFCLGSATFRMTGGVVSNGSTDSLGGNIGIGSGKLIISGGEITGGTAAKGASSVYLYYTGGEAQITGGRINALEVKDCTEIALSGTPVIELFTIAEGKVFTLGELTTGADITVAAKGVFTTENANAQSFVDNYYVKLADASMYLIVEENKLVVSDAPAGATRAACPHCEGADALWYRWDGVSTTGHFYLTGKCSLSAPLTIPAGEELVLDLKGNIMENTAGQAILLKGGLAVIDSVGGGEIQGAGMANGAVISASGSGNTFALYSGTLRYVGAGVGPTHGGVLAMSATTAKLAGGVITDGKVKDRGGNIYITGASNVTISGTVIQNGYSDGESLYGGGNIASVSNSTLTITGGKVIGGTAVVNAGNILAGSGKLIISGGEITGGTAPTGADVLSYMAASSATAEISGGKIGEMALIVSSKGGVTISGSAQIGKLSLAQGMRFNLGELTEGANVGITGSGAITAKSEYAENALSKGYIHAEAPYALRVEDQILHVAYTCEHCGQVVTWEAWDGVATDGHFYMNESLTLDERVTFDTGALVLDLNGKTLSCSKADKIFSVTSATLVIMDRVGGGQVIGSGVSGSSNMNGAVIYLSKATFELYGGTLRHNYGSGVAYRGGVLYVASSTVNLKGGTIEGGKVANRGGNIYATNADTVITISGTTITGGNVGTGNSISGGNLFITSDATVIMEGGKILNGVAGNNGGNVAVGTATFKISGGEISGGSVGAGKAGPDLYIYYGGSNAEITGGHIETVTYTEANSFQLSGAPIIDRFEITAGKTVTLGDLTDGASIRVAPTATSVVTTAHSQLAAYLEKGYFLPASANVSLTVEEEQLKATVS